MVIRGKILEQNNNSIKIQSHEGNIFVFPAGDIEKISQEKIWGNFVYKDHGFANFTELGPLIAGKTTIDGVTTAAFSFQTVNGYKFCQYAMAGIGIGADLYATQTVLPVFASFRGDLSKTGSVIPFYLLMADMASTSHKTLIMELRSKEHHVCGRVWDKNPF